MNKELLNRISEHILEEPRRLNMNYLFRRVEPNSIDAPKCGTVGCIAGWACLLSNVDMEDTNDLWDTARDLLGLTMEESERLFSEPDIAIYNSGEQACWPYSLAEEYEDADTPKERAEVTVRRIKLFSDTNGEE